MKLEIGSHRILKLERFSSTWSPNVCTLSAYCFEPEVRQLYADGLIFGLQSELELEPRYPLFGGWQVTFTIGYGVPLQDFVFKTKDGLRFLNTTFGSPFTNVVVEELTVKVRSWFLAQFYPQNKAFHVLGICDSSFECSLLRVLKSRSVAYR
jgi:hypothetical protein